MAQSGYTPIQLYHTVTPGTVPLAANLLPGELALNIADGKVFYEDSSGVVQEFTGGIVDLATEVTGTLPVANGGIGAATLTDGNVLFGNGTSAVEASTLLTQSAAVTSGTYVKGIGYADTVVALGNTGAAINLDVVSGGVFTATLTGSATITLRYPVSSGASSFILILTNDATAGRSVSFAGGAFKYPGGSVTRTTTANATDIWFFMTPNGGTTYYASIPMANLS